MTPTKSKIWLPGGFSNLSTAISITNFALNASTIKWAYMFQAPKTGTLDKFEFLVGGTLSLNSGSQIRASFQDPSTTNAGPDETQDQFRDIAGSAFSADAWMVPGLLTSDGSDSGSKRSVTAGDFLCAVLEFQTFNTGDTFQTASLGNAQITEGPFSWPITSRKSGGTWTIQNTRMIAALKYNDGSYETLSPITPPMTGSSTFGVKSDSVDQAGLLFKFPIELQIDALFAGACPFNHSSDGQFIIYDAANRVITSVSIDATMCSTTIGGLYYQLAAPITLNANTFYRLILKGTSVNGININYADFSTESLKSAYQGPDWKWTQRTGTGAWTDTATRLPFVMGLQVSGFGDAASAIFPRRAVSVST